MSPEILEIQPRELKFIFELKKRSSCSVQLVNNFDEYVAFKVKTTSPRKYCVRPQTGIILPKSICDFIVTMVAQRVAPPNMVCKDKFLIQSTIVPFGTTAEDITPSMFIKDNDTYIEENKLRVVLVSPPNFPTLLPINGALKQDSDYKSSILKDQLENLQPPYMIPKGVTELKTAKHVEEFKLSKYVEELKPAEDIEELKLTKDVMELKSKLNELELKLNEAEITITKLTEERSKTIQETATSQQELAALRRKNDIRRVKVGFPFSFMSMVAFVSFLLGYLYSSF